MATIDGLEFVITEHLHKMIDNEIKRRFEKLMPEISKKYQELLDLRNMEFDQFNDGFLSAREGKLESDHPHYDFDTDNWRIGFAWGMYEPMKKRIEDLLINSKTSLSVENDDLGKDGE